MSSSQDCSTFLDQISLLVEGSISDALRVSLMTHASRCPTCRDELDAEHRLSEILPLWDVPGAPPHLASRIEEALDLIPDPLLEEKLASDESEIQTFNSWSAPSPRDGFAQKVLGSIEAQLDEEIADPVWDKVFENWDVPGAPSDFSRRVLRTLESESPVSARPSARPRQPLSIAPGGASIQPRMLRRGSAWKMSLAAGVLTGLTLSWLLVRQPTSSQINSSPPQNLAIEDGPEDIEFVPTPLSEEFGTLRTDAVDLLVSADPIDPFVEPFDRVSHRSGNDRTASLDLRRLARLATR